MELVTVEDIREKPELYASLEHGKILFFPHAPWEFSSEDGAFLRSISQTSSSYHKNIAYRPGSGKVTGFDEKVVSDPKRLRNVMKSFSDSVLGFMQRLLPRYMDTCRIDYASFRGIEEEGRNLAFKKRNDLLHIDAFPTRPTGGDLILRTFVNIHPTRSRVWLTSDPFESLAHKYAIPAGWPRMAAWDPLTKLLMRRSAYDRFMLRFHDYLKGNREYQEHCTKYRWEFPPGSAWMVFTDVVPHAVLSGQHALEQTIMVSRQKLLTPASAPVEILRSVSASS